MQPRTRSWRWLYWMLPASVALGAFPALIELLFTRESLAHFTQSALQGMVYASFISIPCCIAFPPILSRIERKPLSVRITVCFAVLAVFCVAGCLAANLLFLATGVLRLNQFEQAWRWSLRICLIVTFAGGFVNIAFATLQGRLRSARDALHDGELAAARARYASLESRVHPHFLFNTLNSVSALIREDPREAERTIERLSELLRYSLDSEVAGLATLNEELRVVRAYLEIEKVRFGARLRYRIVSAAEAGSRVIPALSIQTLVENSVKYAVGSSSEGAEIQVTAELTGDLLRVEVSDDGPGFSGAFTAKPGHGLDLLQRRLTSLFGAAATLEISAANGRTTVAISVPS